MVIQRGFILCCLFIGGIFSISSMANNANKLPKEYYIFSTVANVREKAIETSPIVDQLVNGDTVTALERENSLVIDNIKGDWLKVSYFKKGKKRKGYLWGGNLSFTQLKRGDLRFVFGLESYEKEQQRYIASIKVIKAKGIVAQRWFYVDATRVEKISGQFINKPTYYNDAYYLKLTFSDKSGNGLNHYYFKYAKNEQSDSNKNLVYLIKTLKLKTPTSHHIETVTFKHIGDLLAVKLYKTANIVGKEKHIEYQYYAELYDWDGAKFVLNKHPYPYEVGEQ